MTFIYFTISLILLIMIIIGMVYGVLGHRIQKAIQYERARVIKKHKTVITEFSPPLQLSPVEIAYLYDQHIDDNDFLAIIIDLEQRGYIRLHSSPKGIMGTATHKEHQGLHAYELTALSIIMHHPFPLHKRPSFLRVGYKKISLEVKNALNDKGIIIENAKSINTNAILRALQLGVGVIVIIGFVYNISHLDNFSTIDNLLVYCLVAIGMLLLVAVGSFIFVLGLGAYQRNHSLLRLTKELEALWPSIEGFRQYVAVVEQDNLRYENNMHTDISNNRVLPYAIALNIDTSLYKRLHSL